MNRTREETNSRPSDGRNTTPSKIIDLANSEEEFEPLIQNTNLVGISPRKNEACRTQFRPVCSKAPKDLFEGAVGRKLEDGKTKEKTKRGSVLPRNPVKVTEIDLVRDPEDKGRKPSTEVEQIGTAPRLAQSGITIEVKLLDGINISTTTINVTSEATRKSLSSNK